jgi:imidazolonepropionase-like amidohydrolase
MDQYERGLEFKYRKELCHMDNMDILLQATKYSAEIAGLNNSLGEIKRGYRANMILVDGNPDEDISVMYHKPFMVFKDGKLVRNNI